MRETGGYSAGSAVATGVATGVAMGNGLQLTSFAPKASWVEKSPLTTNYFKSNIQIQCVVFSTQYLFTHLTLFLTTNRFNYYYIFKSENSQKAEK